MMPKSADEMRQILAGALIQRVYGEITAAALKGPVSEETIRTIENRALAMLGEAKETAHDFPFPVETVVANQTAHWRQFFEHVAVMRRQKSL